MRSPRALAVVAAALVVGLAAGGVARGDSPSLSLEATLSPTDRTAASAFGSAVAISSDGGTALMAGPDDGNTGAVWAFGRSGSTWAEEQKLTPSSGSGGGALALSSDGTTALVGNIYGGSDSTGLVDVYTRSGSSWSSQQEIVPSDALESECAPGDISFGSTLALSPDGNTAVVGGPGDGTTGGVWVYTRSGSTWSEATKIVPSDLPSGCSNFGESVALSGDGSTLVASTSSAVWIYVKSGSSWVEQQKIAASSVQLAVSSDGSTALVADSGALTVYTRSGSTWSEHQELDISGDGSDYPTALSLSADSETAAVGTAYSGASTGAAIVYTESSGTWSEQESLAPSAAAGARFGNAVALSGEGTLLVGGPDDIGGGSLWAYTRSGSTWTEQQKLPQPSDAVPATGQESVYAAEGAAISSDGITALIGNPWDGGPGAVWVYTRSGSTWSEQQKIPAPADVDGSFQLFGMTIGLTPDGNTAFIGGSAAGRGAVWIYTRSGSTWTEVEKLSPTDTTEFGFRIAISADGDTVAITALNNDGTDSGAYIYILSGSTWTEQQKIVYPLDGSPTLFGTSAALSGDGDTMIVGASDGNRVYVRSGSTWTEQAKLGDAGDALNTALSSDGQTAIVQDDSGTFVYTRSGATWSEQQQLNISPSNLPNGLVLSADATIAFSSGSDGIDEFVKSGSSWTEAPETSTPEDAGQNAALAISGDETRLLVGDAGGGLVYTLVSGGPASAPTELARPTLSAVEEIESSIPIPLVGNTLTVSDGTWSGSPTITYQWYRCDSPPTVREFDDCVAIDGATDASYTLADADLGHTIQAVVTATNDGGSASDDGLSPLTPGLTGAVGAPTPTVDDASIDVDGTTCDQGACAVQVGQTLTAHHGTWDGEGGPDAIDFSYQWQRCDTESCVDIPGATGVSYAPTADDVGSTFVVIVTGTNSYGANGPHWNVPTGTVDAASSGGSGGSGSGGSGSVPSGGGTPASGGSGGSSSPTAPASSPSTAAESAVPGSAGTVAIGSGVTGISVTWQGQSFTAPVTVTLAEANGTGAAFAVGDAVTLTVKAADGSAVTSFPAPLELVFPDAPAGVVPAYSPDGATWVAMPQLSSPSLPAGFRDGWYRDANGAIHVLTLHATYFGLLTAASTASAEFSAALVYPRSVNVRKTHTLTITVKPTLPARMALVLRKGSVVVAKKSVSVKAGTRHVGLELPARLRAGTYTLTAVLTAERERSSHVVTVAVVARGKG